MCSEEEFEGPVADALRTFLPEAEVRAELRRREKASLADLDCAFEHRGRMVCSFGGCSDPDCPDNQPWPEERRVSRTIADTPRVVGFLYGAEIKKQATAQLFGGASWVSVPLGRECFACGASLDAPHDPWKPRTHKFHYRSQHVLIDLCGGCEVVLVPLFEALAETVNLDGLIYAIDSLSRTSIEKEKTTNA